MVGRQGRVTGRIAPGLVGEVMVQVRGGTEAFHAYAGETELRAAADATRVRTEAEAQAQAKRLLGQASADAAQAQALADAEARKARGLADAEARRAQGLAEAEAIKARGAALAENQEAVITQQLVTQLPMVVAAGAKSFENVEHMVLLNGADGVTDVFSKALTMGGTGLGLAGQMLASMGDQALRRSLPEQNGEAKTLAVSGASEAPAISGLSEVPEEHGGDHRVGTHPARNGLRILRVTTPPPGKDEK